MLEIKYRSVDDLKTLKMIAADEFDLIWSSRPTTHSDYREWIATMRYGSPYKMGFAEYIVSEHDVGELALVFHASYERSEDSEAIKQERAQNAKKWYNYLLSIQNELV